MSRARQSPSFLHLALVLGLLMTATALPETRPAAARAGSDTASALRAFGRLLRDPRFLGVTAIGGFGLAGFFVYLANSSFVMPTTAVLP